MKINITTDGTNSNQSIDYYGPTNYTLVDSVRRQYEEDLLRRQKQHIDNLQSKLNQNWRPCLHDSCPSCIGTGIKSDGSMCVHNISCPCPKCSPTC